LGKPTVNDRQSLEPHETPAGERKTVTALFADITGSTEVIADLDPEEACEIVDPAPRLMIDAVHLSPPLEIQAHSAILGLTSASCHQ
jgi:class 3 adenylate cyclase